MLLPAIKYVGPWGDWSGMGEACRNYILALERVGVDVSTEKVSHVREFANYGDGYQLASALENKPNNYKVKIIHMTGNLFLNQIEPLKYHIAHLFWEVDRMDPEWVWNTNLADEVWTGSEYSKKALLKSGVKKPIFVFPQPVRTEFEPLETFQINKHKGFLFYSIFQWIERKNPKALLQAYWQEFEGRDDVSLLLKVFGLNYSAEETQKIRKDIQLWKTQLGQKHYPRIFIDTALRDKEDIYRIHNMGDCFVLPHRGEGWGIPITEAMTFGKPVITTNLGGCTEWFDKETAYLLRYKMVPLSGMDFVPWYTTDQQWADVDIMDLRGKMRYVFEHQNEANALGLKGQELAKNKFNFEAVGNLLKARLLEIGKEYAS